MDLEEMGPTNLQTLPDPTDADGIFSYTVTHSGLNALGVTAGEQASSLIFSAAESSGGSGGCDTGVGAFAAFALAGLAAGVLIPRKKSR
jgi:hypothetical protein